MGFQFAEATFNCDMGQLTLLRHGQSTWNLEDRFTGWIDVDLTKKGEDEARNAGRALLEAEIIPDILHTSVLKRAIKTGEIALDEMGLNYIDVQRHWRLNERHYGSLQGKNKEETKERFSREQVRLWRRSFDTPPPALEVDDPSHPRHDRRYKNVASELLPNTECLKDVLERMLPYYFDVMVPQLKAGRSLLVAAHGNSLRALVMHLESLNSEEILNFEIPNGQPIVYSIDENLNATRTHWLGRQE